MSEALALSAVDALYGESHVLHEVSFALDAGKVLALLGRNGAGKTTCMSSIIGFLQPRRGEIRLFGDPISRLAPEAIARRGIGFVPQGRRIFHTLTVRENLTVSARSRVGAPVPWTLERVVRLFPRLKERLQQVAGSLSGGEQQMLAIGRALMGNPRVLLIIARLKEEGQSILLVEQNVKLALDLADDVVILNTGRVAFRGTADQVRVDQALITQHLGVF
jgi:branched-chain amino acid transport system ATP-binding protein